MKTTQYLDAVKKKLGIESDYALAPRLGLTRFGVSKLRNGISAMGTTTAAKIAEILEIDPMKVIADAELERGSDDALWTRIAQRVAVVAGGVASYLLVRAMLPDLTITDLVNAFVWPAVTDVALIHIAAFITASALLTLLSRRRALGAAT
jgi:hypothetical protein